MSYKSYLRSIGRKPIRGKLRTEKAPGSVEIVWDPVLGDYRKHVHEGEPVKPKLELVSKRRVAA